MPTIEANNCTHPRQIPHSSSNRSRPAHGVSHQEEALGVDIRERSGEVRSGGEFPFKSGLKLRDAIALAGGFTYRANETHVLLVREGSPQQYRVAMPADIDVLPGDNIRVPERFF